MIVTQQAAVHFCNDYLDNSHSTQNRPPRIVKQRFQVTRKLVREQKEIQGISLIDWQENPLKRTTLLTDCAVELSTAKAKVFPDSVLCMGKMKQNPICTWMEKIEWFIKLIAMSRIRWNRRRADGVRVDKIPRIHCIADSRQDPEHDD